MCTDVHYKIICASTPKVYFDFGGFRERQEYAKAKIHYASEDDGQSSAEAAMGGPSIL